MHSTGASLPQQHPPPPFTTPLAGAPSAAPSTLTSSRWRLQRWVGRAGMRVWPPCVQLTCLPACLPTAFACPRLKSAHPPPPPPPHTHTHTLQRRWPTPLWGESRCSTAAFSARRRSQCRWVGVGWGGPGARATSFIAVRPNTCGPAGREPAAALRKQPCAACHPSTPRHRLLLTTTPFPPPPPSSPPRCLSWTSAAPAAGCAWASPTQVGGRVGWVSRRIARCVGSAWRRGGGAQQQRQQ